LSHKPEYLNAVDEAIRQSKAIDKALEETKNVLIFRDSPKIVNNGSNKPRYKQDEVELGEYRAKSSTDENGSSAYVGAVSGNEEEMEVFGGSHALSSTRSVALDKDESKHLNHGTQGFSQGSGRVPQEGNKHSTESQSNGKQRTS